MRIRGQVEVSVSPVIVREATVKDAEALLNLYRQLGGHGPPPTLAQAVEAIGDTGEQPWVHLLVATIDDVVVGTATLVIVPGMAHASRPWGQIENMVVHEDQRRKGIGEALMQRCDEISREAGAYKLQLMSSHPRKAAHAFYERMGFDPQSVGFRKYF